jgi:hypothetical protein
VGVQALLAALSVEELVDELELLSPSDDELSLLDEAPSVLALDGVADPFEELA